MNYTTLILLPGLDGTGDLFRPLLDVIPPSIRVEVVSYPTDQKLSLDSLFEFIESRLRGEREMVLVGESFSGPLALRYASAHPTRTKGIVLCASFISPPAPRWLRHFVWPLLFRVPLPAFAVRYFLIGPMAPASLVREVKRTIRRVQPNVLAQRLREVLSLECSDALISCAAPILYLSARQDALVSLVSCEKMQAIRQVRIRTVEGPHLLLQTEPVACWREIEQFLCELQ